MNERQKIGQNLKNQRENKGISRYFLNKQTGLKYDLINSIERGSSNYTIESLLTYCDFLNIKLLELTLKTLKLS